MITNMLSLIHRDAVARITEEGIMKIQPYYNEICKQQEFRVHSANHGRTVRAWASVNRFTNETKWFFKYEQNGQTKEFKSWENGLDFLEAKGW